MHLGLTTLLVVCGAVSSAAAVDAEVRPDLRHFKSRYVSYSWPRFSTATTLWVAETEPAGSRVRPRINMNLTNKSDRAFWLEATLTPPTPYEGRTGVVYLGPNETVEFESTQDSIIAEADYEIDLLVFADSARTDTLEVGRTRVWFDRGNVQRLEERLELERCQYAVENEVVELPKTFERIVMKKNMGFLTSLSGRLGGSGTVVVGRDGLEHVSKKRTTSITAAQVRAVSWREHDSGSFWVVVEYLEEGDSETLWFDAAPFGRGAEMEACVLSQLLAAIEALIARRDEGNR